MRSVKEESGCMFYSPPEAMDEWLDPLMRPVCEEINASGWVWTAESCQGHPDHAEGGTWADNVRPMLRLVTEEANVGRMFAAILEAYQIECRAAMATHEPNGLAGFEVWPITFRNPGWAETLIYLNAKTVYQRDSGMGLWKTFAKIVNRKA